MTRTTSSSPPIAAEGIPILVTSAWVGVPFPISPPPLAMVCDIRTLYTTTTRDLAVQIPLPNSVHVRGNEERQTRHSHRPARRRLCGMEVAEADLVAGVPRLERPTPRAVGRMRYSVRHG